MAFVFGDSFDHYADARLTEKWTARAIGSNGSTTIVAGAGARGTQGLQLAMTDSGGGANLSGTVSIVPTMPVPSGATCICGFSITVGAGSFQNFNAAGGTTPDNGAPCLFVIRGATVNLIWMWINTNGKLSIYRNTSLLGTTSIGLSEAVTSFVEFQVLLSDTVGTVDVWIDNANVLSLSAIDTTFGGTTWDEFRWGDLGSSAISAVSVTVDNFYLLDGSGAVPAAANRWGPTSAYATVPNAVGTNSEWTRSTGADQWATIDEALMNGDTDYNTTATLNALDLLNFPVMPVTGAPINGIQANLEVRTEDGGASEVKVALRTGGTTYLGTARTMPSSFAIRRENYAVNPDTSVAFTDAVVNAAEWGYKKTA